MSYNQEQLDNVQFIYDFFSDRGWSAQAIAGMLGNMETESYLYPHIWEGGTEPGTGTGPGYGLVQWTPETNLTDWAEANDLDPSEIETQCLRIQFEFDNNEQYIPTDEYPMTAEEFMVSTESPYTLAMVFLHNYERPASTDQPQRGDQAEYWFDHITNDDDNGNGDSEIRSGQHLIVLGHGLERSTGEFHEGATAIDGTTTEAQLLRGDLYNSLQEYADESEADIEFYDENLVYNGEAELYVDYASVTELHFDSSTNPDASGGHAIILLSQSPNEMDSQFIDMIDDHFTLWSGMPDGYDNSRDDLGNVNTFSDAGTNYRLLELGFITNQGNFDYILENYDSVAQDIIEIITYETNGNGDDPDPDPDPETYTVQEGDTLTSIAAEFGVTVDDLVEWNNLSDPDDIQVGQELIVSDPDPDPGEYPPPEPGEGLVDYMDRIGMDSSFENRALLAEEYGIENYTGTAEQNEQLLQYIAEGSTGGDDPDDSISTIQEWLNSNYDSGLDVDGSFGPATREAVVRAVQTQMNADYNAGLEVDGSFGPATQAAWQPLTRGATGNLVQLVQARLIGAGYDPLGFDGSFGPGMEAAVIQFQTDQNITIDGFVGPETSYTLFNL